MLKKQKLKFSLAFGLAFSLFSQNSYSQEVPEQCVQLPQRTQVCPNLLYKRASLSLPSLNVIEGEMVCICMADFQSIRIAAATEQGKIDELVELGRLANQLSISESDLVSLIRE